MMRGMLSEIKRHRIADAEQSAHSGVEQENRRGILCAVGDKDHICW